jgi:7-cyano-7-deazaguanine synthase in queuosine biosynthesis
MTSIFVRRSCTARGGADVVFEKGKNLQDGERDFVKHFGSITTLEQDLLLIAASILSADRSTPRGEREDLTRAIELSIPVINIGRLQPFSQNIEYILRALSNDSWRIRLRQEDGSQESAFQIPACDGKTLLFSGGLDSLAAGFEYSKTGKELQLVSHLTRNKPTREAQATLVTLLKKSRPFLTHRQFFVSSRDGKPSPGLDHDAENSQRTRSFLFLVLGALAARRVGHRKILLLAENGQMAIHLPLTQGRIGAFSTHTAHPDVLVKMQEFFQAVLLDGISIDNPYVFRTKAEVVKVLWTGLRQSIPFATSCWKNTRLPSETTHCGICVPCIIRRIAIECHGKDTTAYARDPFVEQFSSLPPEDDARRNLADLAEFMVRFETSEDQDILDEWPELYSPNIDKKKVLDMYKRAAKQTRTVLSRYPNLASLLK